MLQGLLYLLVAIIKPLKRFAVGFFCLSAHDFPVPKGSLRERDAYGKVVGYQSARLNIVEPLQILR